MFRGLVCIGFLPRGMVGKTVAPPASKMIIKEIKLVGCLRGASASLYIIFPFPLLRREKGSLIKPKRGKVSKQEPVFYWLFALIIPVMLNWG